MKCVKNKDFSIEFDFYKSAGTVVPIITYIARKFIKEKGFVCISLRAMPEIEEYTRKSSIDLIPSLSKGGIEHLIRQAEKSYQDVLKK